MDIKNNTTDMDVRSPGAPHLTDGDFIHTFPFCSNSPGPIAPIIPITLLSCTSPFAPPITPSQSIRHGRFDARNHNILNQPRLSEALALPAVICDASLRVRRDVTIPFPKGHDRQEISSRNIRVAISQKKEAHVVSEMLELLEICGVLLLW